MQQHADNATAAATPVSGYHLVTIKSENAISASVTPGSESIVENRSLNCGRTKVTITITTATENREDHRVHERRFDLLVHLVRLLVMDGEPLRDPVELAAALACADHAEHERWEHLLRLECGGKARAFPHLTQHSRKCGASPR